MFRWCFTQKIVRAAPLLILLFGLTALTGLLGPARLEAADGIAISGSFKNQVFLMPQDSSASGPSINVVVFNNSDEDFQVTMTTVAMIDNGQRNGTEVIWEPAPPGVTMSLSNSDFVLQAHSNQEIQVGLAVALEAVTGEYKLEVSAQGSRGSGTGFELVGVAGQSARLTVIGQSATVIADTVSPGGQPVVTTIRLFRLVGTETYELVYSNSGHVEAKVSPGDYIVKAYGYQGEMLADQEFYVAADETKTVALTVETVFFRDFEPLPATNTRTGEFDHVQVVYTIANVYQSVDNAEVRMEVTFNGGKLEEVSLLTLSVLERGDRGVQSAYFASGGWQDGTYGFKLQLYIGGQPYTSTEEKTLDVGAVAQASGSWLWIVFVILGILGTAGLGFLIFFLLKRRQKGEKPEKAEKKERKKKEEKPARKAEEPLPKPAPYRPAEHVRPVEPVRYEEPTVEPTAEPATLSTVSTLKARMASMGRDQGTGKVAEEEPDTETKDEPVETGPLSRQPVPVPPPPKIEPERPAVKKVEDKGHKPPASEKPAGHKPGIFSKVTATGKKEPPKPPVAQGPVPVKPGDEIQINWPPKTVEPPKPPSDVQINWPPKPVEPPKPSALEEAVRQRVEAQQHVEAPEEAAPEEEVPSEEHSEPVSPPSRSSFSEAARLRMEARLRASETGKTGAGPGESQTGGDADGGSGEGGDHSP